MVQLVILRGTTRKIKLKFGECRKQGLNFIMGSGPKQMQKCQTISETRGHTRFQSPWRNLCGNQHTAQSHSVTAHFRTDGSSSQSHFPSLSSPSSSSSSPLSGFSHSDTTRRVLGGVTAEALTRSQDSRALPLPERSSFRRRFVRSSPPPLPQIYFSAGPCCLLPFFFFLIFVNENLRMAFNCFYMPRFRWIWM